MFIAIIISIAVVSVLLACYSLWRQQKFEEVKKAKKQLKRSKVIYHRDVR